MQIAVVSGMKLNQNVFQPLSFESYYHAEDLKPFLSRFVLVSYLRECSEL